MRLELSEAKRLKGLEDENRRLKKLLAEAMQPLEFELPAETTA